ncbi:MAG TPA: phage major capsid protein [Sphingomonas sp.]|jgi:HK97 family phage major capsid protein
MKTHELQEQRAAIVTRMTDAHKADDNDAFTAAETELRSHDAKLSRANAIDDAERRETGITIHGKVERRMDDQSILETLRYAAGMPVENRAKIEEQQAELAERAGTKPKGVFIATECFERRAQLTTNSEAITPTDYRPELFTSMLTASTVMQAMGATVLTGLTGDVEFPRETGSPAVGWVNENQALPTGDASFNQVRMTPHHVGAITELSRQLLMQSSPAADQLVRQMLARNIGLEIDRAAIAGTGIGAEPRGLLFDPGIATVPYATDLFITTADMIAVADLGNVDASRGFLSTNGVKASAMKLRTVDGSPIALADTFHGEPVRFTNQAPNDLGTDDDEHALVYGDFRDFLMGLWSTLDILVNPYAETAYSKGNVLIRAMATVDFAVRRPASFVKASGVPGTVVSV